MFEFNEKAATESTGNGGSKCLETGVYDVTLITVSKTIAKTGTEGIDVSFQVEGSKYPNVVYGMWHTKSNGDSIAFNANKIQALMGLLGGKGLTEFTKEIEVRGGTKNVTAYKETEKFVCKLAIKKSLDIYNGDVTEKNEIEAFLSAEGKTYAEQAGNKPAKQMEYYSSKMKDSESKAYKAYIADGGAQEESEDTDEGSLL